MICRENAGLKIYICYIERHVNTHTEFKEGLARRNFVLQEFGQDVTKQLN